MRRQPGKATTPVDHLRWRRRWESAPFYRKCGWRPLEGQTVRTIGNRQRLEVSQGPALLLPVRARPTDWPLGHAVDRNGLGV